MNPRECQSHRGETCCIVTGERSKCKAYSSWFKVRLDVKFVSGTECSGETCCIVLIWERKTGRSIQGFCFQKSWPVKFGKISSWRQKKSFAQSSKVWTCETRTSSWITQWLHQWATATCLCSKFGIIRRSTRIYWFWTRTRSTTRRIIYEGKGSRDTQIRSMHKRVESSKTTSWWSLGAKIKRKSWDNTQAHLSVAGNARADECYEWCRWISRSGIEL